MKPPFIRKQELIRSMDELRAEYQRRSGRPLRFPLALEDIFYDLFGLEVIYDTQGRLNNLGDGIIGCLFPDGHPSPWEKDKIIAVNLTANSDFDPTNFGQQHTIAHEGAGHYVIHFLKGISASKEDRPKFCRTSERKDPLEWQADFAAAVFTQPAEKVAWLLDGKKPGELIDVDLYAKNYREFFGATRSAMEMRLLELGYKLFNTRNEWAGLPARPARRKHSSLNSYYQRSSERND